MSEDSENKNDITIEDSILSSSAIHETKTGMLDDALREKLEQAFHKETSQILLHHVAKVAIEHDPIDLAYAATRLPISARVVLYENLPDLEAKIIFMINTTSSTRSTILRAIDDQEIKLLIDNMPTDEAVWLLDDMSDRRMKRVFHLLDAKILDKIRKLQKHDRHSAGRLMTDEFFAFHMNTTIGQVSSYVRDNPGIEPVRIFVLNDSNEIAGYVPERNLIINQDNLPLRKVMRPVLHTVTPSTSRDEVVDIVERYKIPVLPVVDVNDHLIGVINYEDVVEAMEDIADETIASIAGTAEDYSELEPVMKKVFWRAPWLVVTLCAGLLTSSVMAHLRQFMWFAFVPIFVPLIAGMSGNVGLQSSTILVRGMSTGELSVGSRKEALGREIRIGLVIGLIFGLLCGLVVFCIYQFILEHVNEDPLMLGTTVFFGIFVACVTAASLGAFSPFFFARIGVDPAIASGPIVAAFNDVISSLMFFLVARVIYTLFS